jgi:hypothetical protein
VPEHQVVHLELPTMQIASDSAEAPDGTMHFGQLLAVFAHRRGRYHHVGASPTRLRCMPGQGETMVISRGITTSIPYTKKKGIAPVA